MWHKYMKDDEWLRSSSPAVYCGVFLSRVTHTMKRRFIMTHAQTTLKLAAILFAVALWAQMGNAQTSTPASDSATASASAPSDDLIDAAAHVAGAMAAQMILDSLNERDRVKPEASAADIEARDIIVGAMMSEATEAKTCTMITVVAPKATGIWDSWTSNRDLSIASVSDLGAGATVAYQPIYNEAGFAVGIFGSNETIQLREHGLTGARVLHSGSKEVIKRALERKGYVVGFTHSIPCHFSWRDATAKDRYKILLKARQSVKES